MSKNVKSILIDGEDLVLGRLATHIAKLLLSGEHVIVFNAEKIIISGSTKNIISSKKDSIGIITHAAPSRGPFHYRGPDRIVKRTIRGMLPWKKSRGKEAYKRLRVYTGKPQELENQICLPLPKAKLSDPYRPYMTLEDISKELGWRKIR